MALNLGFFRAPGLGATSAHLISMRSVSAPSPVIVWSVCSRTIGPDRTSVGWSSNMLHWEVDARASEAPTSQQAPISNPAQAKNRAGPAFGRTNVGRASVRCSIADNESPLSLTIPVLTHPFVQGCGGACYGVLTVIPVEFLQ